MFEPTIYNKPFLIMYTATKVIPDGPRHNREARSAEAITAGNGGKASNGPKDAAKKNL